MPKLTGDCGVTIATHQRPVSSDDDNNDKEMTMVTLTMMVTVVIEASKLLAIVSLQAFKHILHQPTEIIKSLGIVFPKTIIIQSHNVDDNADDDHE